VFCWVSSLNMPRTGGHLGSDIPNRNQPAMARLSGYVFK
jgi:hypothetical protein